MLNNTAKISGTIVKELKFSHEVHGEKFYQSEVSSIRLSGTPDIIPFIISERLISGLSLNPGTYVVLCGPFRSYNLHRNDKHKLILNLLVKEILVTEEELYENTITLNGFICKDPIFRFTPKERAITDLIIAVHRPFKGSDYIPCITWGVVAKYAGELNIGDQIKAVGRIQSRQYNKKISETEQHIRTAYEVSITNLELIEEKKEEPLEDFDENCTA